MTTPMDGPFNSIQELEDVKKVYEDYFHIQLGKCYCTTIEAYRKRAPNLNHLCILCTCLPLHIWHYIY